MCSIRMWISSNINRGVTQVPGCWLATAGGDGRCELGHRSCRGGLCDQRESDFTSGGWYCCPDNVFRIVTSLLLAPSDPTSSGWLLTWNLSDPSVDTTRYAHSYGTHVSVYLAGGSYAWSSALMILYSPYTLLSVRIPKNSMVGYPFFGPTTTYIFSWIYIFS